MRGKGIRLLDQKGYYKISKTQGLAYFREHFKHMYEFAASLQATKILGATQSCFEEFFIKSMIRTYNSIRSFLFLTYITFLLRS
jgi:hypothetical protein